tara:strand:+ start:7240 stop:8121 length:882 start_codon:yes stop_codon:yes gene_type:complete
MTVSANIIAAYFALTKPRVTPLLLIVTLATMMVASPDALPLWTTIGTLAGGALAVGAAGAFNNAIDHNIDLSMARTSARPVASGQIPVRNAIIFGWVLTFLSVSLMLATVNLLATGLTCAAIIYYALIYSKLLKLHTPQNIVLGGAAGAAPTLIGWAAITNRLEIPALALFLLIFCWTPPHFWALALILKDEYKDANVPMLPVVSGVKATVTHILIYTMITVVVSIALIPLFSTGPLYLFASLFLGSVFVWLAMRLHSFHSAAVARGLFAYSMLYLALLFLALALDLKTTLLS